MEEKTSAEASTSSKQISANSDFGEIQRQGDPTDDHARTICRFCGSSLAAPGAWKCVDCSEYQTWPLQVFSRIGLGDLALLVAVGSLAWIAVQDLVRGEKAALDLKVVECTTSRISIAVFNSGSQPGILSGLELAIVHTNAVNASEAKVRLPLNKDMNENETGAIQVAPSKPVLRNYRVTASMKNAFPKDCALRVVANKYEESKPQSREIDKTACSCNQVI